MKVYDYRNIHKFSRTRLDYYKVLHIFRHDRIYWLLYINYACIIFLLFLLFKYKNIFLHIYITWNSHTRYTYISESWFKKKFIYYIISFLILSVKKLYHNFFDHNKVLYHIIIVMAFSYMYNIYIYKKNCIC